MKETHATGQWEQHNILETAGMHNRFDQEAFVVYELMQLQALNVFASCVPHDDHDTPNVALSAATMPQLLLHDRQRAIKLDNDAKIG